MRLKFTLTLGDWYRVIRYDFRAYGRMFVAMVSATVGIRVRWVIVYPKDGGVDVSIADPEASYSFSCFTMYAHGVSGLVQGLEAAHDVDELHITFPSNTYRDPPEVVVLPRWAVKSLTRQLRRLKS